MSAGLDRDSLITTARAWIAQDPDTHTRQELETIILSAQAGSEVAVADLHDRFDSRLEFGTAGLRGALGAGPNRMNRVLVAQAAAGLTRWLREREPSPSIVIGYDGRTNSYRFALDTAEIMAGLGARPILLPRMLPTPVLAFAVRALGASAGVMVTASHNPGTDNGYKVYLGDADDGSQIVPPVDAEIASHIRAAALRSVDELPRSSVYETANDRVVEEYIRRTAKIAVAGGLEHSRAPVRFVYTAMHGVGWETASRVFADAGLSHPISVREQQDPDPEFPTVVFPNPEEPGALDLAFETATDAFADLVIANDPDADRLAVAIPDRSAPAGWRRLTGNEVGLLLGWRAAQRAQGQHPPRSLACSLVSSPGLALVASRHGLAFVETLTGFKYISRAPELAFGFEEALGYLVDPDKIRDKDGISAAVDILALAGELAVDGRTIGDHLLAFTEIFGAHASAQVSARVSDLGEIPRVMAALRRSPPTELGSFAVVGVDDFREGFGDFAPNDIVRLWLEDGSRVIFRPSGTEPKVKVYIDVSRSEGTAVERMATATDAVRGIEESVRTLVG